MSAASAFESLSLTELLVVKTTLIACFSIPICHFLFLRPTTKP